MNTILPIEDIKSQLIEVEEDISNTSAWKVTELIELELKRLSLISSIQSIGNY